MARTGPVRLSVLPFKGAADAPVTLVLGLPNWVAVAIVCYVAVALLNAAAWLLADVRDEKPPPEAGER